MIREQRIMKRIADELGDEMNEYIKTFDASDFWKIKEGEVIVNKTFKRVVSIIADFNLTTADEILSNVYELLDSNELMMKILSGMAEQYTQNGGDSLLNRSMVLCYLLHYTTTIEEGLEATDILTHSAESDLMYKKDSLWQSIKYKLGFVPYPYMIRGNTRALGLVAVLRGVSIYDTMKDVAEYKELI